MLNMGPNASSHDTFLLSGILDKPTSHKTILEYQSQIHVGHYVDDFVLYSSYPTQEDLFQTLLQEHIQVDFMVDLDYFLGTEFTWIHHKDVNISVHLCQSELTEFTAHRFLVQSVNKVPIMTPYRSGLPIDSIPPVDTLNPDLPRQRQVYQSIVGCINCLATCIHPDIAAVLAFLASYRNSPHPQHYKAAVYALKYLTSNN